MGKAGFLEIALICGLLLPLTGRPAHSNPAAPAAPAQTEAPAAPCTPLVRMFGQPLCREAMKLDNTDLSKYLKSVPEDKRHLIEDQARLNNARKIKAEIWQKALIHKFGLDAISPTDEEIEGYRSHFNKSLDVSYIADKKTVDLLDELLAKNHYSKSNEAKMRRLLDAAKMSLKLYGERQQHTEAMPKQYRYIAEAAERQMARNLLISWKSDKVLYDTYGGRLVTTETGVTPIDAYAKFLKYIRQEGRFEIVDKEYADMFRETEEFIVAKHEMAPGDEDVAAKYFTSPTWQFSLANNENRFDELRQNLEKIPALGLKDGAVVDEKDLIGKQSRPASPLLGKPPAPAPGKQP